MKTMKTKSNFRKAAMRSTAVVVSFVLVSFTVSAQDFWKKLSTNSSFNEIAMVETSEKEGVPARSNTDNSNWFYFDKAFDPALELESWMTSKNYFNSITFRVVGEVEVPLKLESWMLDETLFYGDEAKEEPLKLEGWMTSAGFWEI